MLESSVVSNKINIGPPFINNSNIRLKLENWIGSDKSTNLTRNSSNRKRFHPSSLDKNKLINSNFESNWKRRREHHHKTGGFISINSLHSTNLNSVSQRRHSDFDRMTRSSCEIRRQNHSFSDTDRGDHGDPFYRRNAHFTFSFNGILTIPPHLNMANKGLLLINGLCSAYQQIPIVDDNQNVRRTPPIITHPRPRIHLTTLHQISPSSQQHQFIPAKEALINTNVTTHINVQSPQIGRNNNSCNSINICTSVHENSNNFHNQSQQNIRRRHRTCDQPQSYQLNSTTQTPFVTPRTVNNVSSQSALAACSIPNRTICHNSTSFPSVTRSFGQNSNQLRFTTYPLTAYTPQQPSIFSRHSLPTNSIHTHNSAFCSAVQLPTIIGDVFTSAPCHQCAIIASSGLNAFSNLSSMLQFSVATSTASLITLAAVSGDRVHGSRLSYVPVHTVNHWHNHHPYLPAAWSYNDLTSILQNPTARNLVQDQLAQRMLSGSANVGVQLVMLAPSSVVGSSNDHSQLRHHIYPLPRTDSISPITVSRYLPTLDHLPLIDQPKPGITRQELDTIPTRKFIKNNNDMNYKVTDDDKDRCMICLEDFMPDEIIRMLRCSHDFHSICVEKWLKINRTCPLCRSDAGLTNHKQ